MFRVNVFLIKNIMNKIMGCLHLKIWRHCIRYKDKTENVFARFKFPKRSLEIVLST